MQRRKRDAQGTPKSSATAGLSQLQQDHSVLQCLDGLAGRVGGRIGALLAFRLSRGAGDASGQQARVVNNMKHESESNYSTAAVVAPGCDEGVSAEQLATIGPSPPLGAP